MLGAFGFSFLLGDQHAVAVSQLHLHVGDAGARRGAGAILHGQLGDARELPQTLQVALIGDEGVLRVHVQAPEQRGAAPLEEDAPVAHVTARAAALHGMRVAVERERKAQLPGLPEQRRKQRRITPLAQNHVRVVGAQQALEPHRYRLLGIVQHPPLAVNFHFQRAPPAMLRVNIGETFQPHPHDLKRRQLIVGRPFVITTLEGANCRGGPRARPVLVGELPGLPPALRPICHGG